MLTMTETIQRWQSFWRQLLSMAYERSNIVESLIAKCTAGDYNTLYVWEQYDSKGHLLKFEHMWKTYSQRRDENGHYVQPLVVPELKTLYVPSLLFNCVGVDSFMKTCFPNCVITYWETGQ